MFNQVNLIVSDIEVNAAFYARLGVSFDLPTSDWPPGSGARHANSRPGDGYLIDLDTAPMARLWGDAELAAGTVVLGFALPDREAVDATYAELIAAGSRARRAPFDAFWGARYAIVDDPDGRAIGLMSPIDPARRHVPEA